MLLAADTGTAHFAVTGGTAWVRSGAHGTSQDRTTGTLEAGDGALVPPGVAITVRNAGDAPAVVLVLTLIPGR
jgi:hypothetical protein